MEGTWKYEKGTYMGDSITFQNNIEINVQKAQNSSSFYLVGWYFGTLYLLNKETLELTKYNKLEEIMERF